MKKSIFSSIKSYIPSENDPAENYLTELLAWTLNNEEFRNFRKDFISIVSKGEIDEFIEYSITTQRYIANKYIDMLIVIDRKYHLIFEHKIFSEMHDIDGRDQLGFYLESYSKELRESESQNSNDINSVLRGILISVKKPRTDKYHVFTWQEIFEKIYSKGLENYELEERFVVENIWTYIHESGYNLVKNIDMESIAIYYKSVDLESNLKSLLENYIQFGLVPKDNKNKRFRYFENQLFYEDRYRRRIGFSFYHSSKDWKPNIFVGLLLDGHDHKLNDKIDDRNGLYSVVILEYDYNGLNKLKNDIKELSKKMKAEICLLNQRTDEKIYDMSEKQWNAYRILVILKPLKEIFGDAIEHDEQAHRLVEYYSSRIDSIISTLSFSSLFELLNK